MTQEISNSKAVLGSQDIQERLDELIEIFNDAFQENGRDSLDFEEAYQKDVEKTEKIITRLSARDEGYAELTYDFEEYHNAIEAFSEIMDFSHWDSGFAIYNDDELTERWAECKMQEFGYIPENLPSIIFDNIDFSGILDDWKQGMSEVELDGQSFWYDTF